MESCGGLVLQTSGKGVTQDLQHLSKLTGGITEDLLEVLIVVVL